MKKLIIFFVILLSSTLAVAQIPGAWQNIRHSSVNIDGNIHFRWENADPTQGAPQFWTRLGTGNWQMQSSSLLEGLSYESTPAYTWGQRLRCRLRSEMVMEGEGVALMHPAWMDDDSFPPTVGKLALIGSDPAGDSLMIQAPMLDFGDTWMGVSSQKLFSTIANQSGSFPTMNSLTSFNAWITTIANPEALADSVMYAMVYTFNIVGVISPGLYKLGVDETMTPTFSRIGNIQSNVSGGRLNMACNLADLTSDPSFGTWPNMSNSLVFSSFSMRLNLDLSTMEPEMLIGDYSMPAMVFFDDIQYQHSSNTLPDVNGPTVNGLLVSCQYQDDQGDFPLLCQFVTEDGLILQMQPTSFDFLNGVTYTAMLSGPIQNGVLQVSDNLIFVQEYKWSAVDAEDPVLVPMALSCAIPNPVKAGQNVPFSFRGLEKGALNVDIFNIRGQRIHSLTHDQIHPGEAQLNWNGLAGNRIAAPGIYLLKARQGGRTITRKFTIIR